MKILHNQTIYIYPKIVRITTIMNENMENPQIIKFEYFALISFNIFAQIRHFKLFKVYFDSLKSACTSLFQIIVTCSVTPKFCQLSALYCSVYFYTYKSLYVCFVHNFNSSINLQGETSCVVHGKRDDPFIIHAYTYIGER